jgi:acetate kinase
LFLVLNAGSSSLKFSLYDAQAQGGPDARVILRGQVEGLFTAAKFSARGDGGGKPAGAHAWPPGQKLGHDGAIAFLIEWLAGATGGAALAGCGHRVVHGGRDFSGPVLVDALAMEQLEALSPLAPLHQPHNLACIRAIQMAMPGLPQVACFDTAFHRTQPWEAETFALPEAVTASGVQRYGFHGLSYAYIAGALPAIDPALAGGRVIVAHLGNGASLCAMRDGKSVATTMGFTPLDGLVMGTRSGTIDPGVIFHLVKRQGMSLDQVERMLTHESGLLGVSGISSDMRTLRARAAEPGAARALALFAYRIVREVGSLAAALGGLDALVFTAGIGENDAELRAEVVGQLGWLGLALDADANARASGMSAPQRLSQPGAASAWMVPTNEELMILRQTRRVLGPAHDA